VTKQVSLKRIYIHDYFVAKIYPSSSFRKRSKET